MMRRHIEIRADDDVIRGVAIKYGDIARTSPPERFAPGSVVIDDPILNLQHDRNKPIARMGAGLTFDDSPEELRFEARLPDTFYARLAREQIAVGLLRGASVEFYPEVTAQVDGVVEVRRARLRGLALVDRPAYPASQLRADGYDASNLQLRAGGVIQGAIQLGVAGITSLAHRRKLLIPRDADIGFADNIFLLDGYDYARSLANTAAGALVVTKSPEALLFHTVGRRLARTPILRETIAKMRGGLLSGAVPGLQRLDTERYTDDDGFEVTVVKRGGLCEINLVARAGQDYAGALR